MEITDIIKNEHMKNITNILTKIGECIEGNLLCDKTPENWTHNEPKCLAKIKNLQTICKDKEKIIEIGVNACHSLMIMLLENPSAEYLLFDLNNHTYTIPVIEYVKKSFPNTKINIFFGNSVQTITKYIEEHSEEVGTYDLCHVDGGHSENVFSVDYENMKKLIKKDGCVVFDDYDYHEIHNFIDRMVGHNEIKQVTENLLQTDRHFIYQYVYPDEV
jgi:predicted O-methyltransferase YrrM